MLLSDYRRMRRTSASGLAHESMPPAIGRSSQSADFGANCFQSKGSCVSRAAMDGDSRSDTRGARALCAGLFS